jgi:CBS-domain-containing membrane protein
LTEGETRLRRRGPVLTHIIDPKLRKSFRYYLLQSMAATALCFLMLISLDVIVPGAVVASLGASTFIVFVGPRSRSAMPRNLLGGQLIGTGTGMACSRLLHMGLLSSLVSHRVETAVFGAIAVGLAIFLMVIIDMEHPPAAGTSLSLVVSEWSIYSIAFIGGATIFLAAVRIALGRKLRDLY